MVTPGSDLFWESVLGFVVVFAIGYLISAITAAVLREQNHQAVDRKAAEDRNDSGRGGAAYQAGRKVRDALPKRSKQ